MSVTIADFFSEFNTIIGDSTEDRITNLQRYAYATKATAWLKEELENDHSVNTFNLDYFDSVYYYQITTAVADYFDTNDLRRVVGENYQSFSNKSSRELAEEIAQGFRESSYTIERANKKAYLGINHASKYPAFRASSLESLTVDGGTWEADVVNSDAFNLAVDSVDFTEGSGSLKFDIDVSQSGNNRATIFNDAYTSRDLSNSKDLASWFLDVKFPDVDDITSVTFYWGTDSSNYYSVTQTTDMNGDAFVADWNHNLQFEWLGATVTGTPDDEDIAYLRIDINYAVGQADATSFKIDNLRLIRPEPLKFYYTSWALGETSAGVDLYKFTASTDVPYFSGQYDQYLFIIAQYGASLAFDDLTLPDRAQGELVKAIRGINRLRDIIPSSVARETKSFKPLGISFNRHRRYRRR